MNQKEAVHERLKEYACVAPDQMMQKLQINAEGLRRKRQSSGDRNMEIMRRHAKNEGYDVLLIFVRMTLLESISTILFFLGLISLVTDVFCPVIIRRI